MCVQYSISRALIHFAWQITSIGKIDYLKAFIKYTFYISYTKHLQAKLSNEEARAKAFNREDTFCTVHNQLILNLVILIRQIMPLQDICQINLIFKNCWFFLEITLKSLYLYSIQYKHLKKCVDGTSLFHLFDEDFYNSLKCLYELFIELIVKYGSSGSLAKDQDLTNSLKSCNRSLAMFIKVKLNFSSCLLFYFSQKTKHSKFNLYN